MDSNKFDAETKGDYPILSEKAFQLFENGNSSLRTMVKFVEARQHIETMISRRLKSFVEEWTKYLHVNIDIEYGAMREFWRELIFESMETAHIHTGVMAHLGRTGGPLDTIKSCLSPEVQERVKELVRRYKKTRDKQDIILRAIERAKKVYHDTCRKYAELEADMDRKGLRSQASPKYLKAKQRLDKQEQKVVGARDTYMTRLQEEEESRDDYLQKMREIREEFDCLEKIRLKRVRQGFLEILEASEKLDERESRRFVINELRHQLDTMNVKDEINKYDDMYMDDVQVSHFEEYTRGKETDPLPAVEQKESRVPEYVNRQEGVAGDSSSLCNEVVYRVILPSLYETPRTVENEGESQSWAGQYKTGKVIRGRKASSTQLETYPVTCNRKAFCQEESSKPEVVHGPTADMTNVKVKAIRSYTGRTTSELSFKMGQTIKQKSTADNNGLAYGWMRKSRTGRKYYGYFPVSLVELKPQKESVTERIARAVSRQN